MRIPSLDGFRGVSMGLVLTAHLAGTRHAPELAWISIFGDVGYLGVRVFLVISGFLMTTLLEREFELTGRIAFRRFMRRRAFRIVPALVVYMTGIAVMVAARVVNIDYGDLLAALTFTTNFEHQRSWYVGHLWSLSVEAQFYVCWAAIAVIAGRTYMLRVALVALVIGPLSRVAIHVLAPDWRWAIGEAFPTVLDAFASGSLLALLQARLESRSDYMQFLHSRASAALPLVLLALNAAMPHIAFSYPIGQLLMNILIALTIHRAIVLPRSMSGRLLNSRAVVAIGTVSYSLYLWQQPFLNRYSTGPVATFPLNIGFALVAALLSYRLVERPALNLNRRIDMSRTASPATLPSNRYQAHATTT